MKVAIIGGGISGLMAASELNDFCEYTLYEADDRLGGHADTHHIELAGQPIAVDTGFIVFNEDAYPHFSRLIGRLGVESQASDMSFSVSHRPTGLEYNATNLNGLFCQRKNLFNPRFYRMIMDIKRFYREAPALLVNEVQVGLYDYLVANDYSDYFIEHHILPMASALWSADFDSIKSYPLLYMLRFMHNHRMLQINDRPQWRTIAGGSVQYVQAVSDHLQGTVRLNCPVKHISREADGVQVHSSQGVHTYDAIVLATHTDQALGMLAEPSAMERTWLQAIPYVENHIDLHTDANIMPRHQSGWASWGVNCYQNPVAGCTVNYWMNKLQSLPTQTPVIVSLNQSNHIREEHILATRTYHHPVYGPYTEQAQEAIQSIQGKNRTYYCGAYLGWGFHEDGARSAAMAVKKLKEDLTHGYAQVA